MSPNLATWILAPLLTFSERACDGTPEASSMVINVVSKASNRAGIHSACSKRAWTEHHCAAALKRPGLALDNQSAHCKLVRGHVVMMQETHSTRNPKNRELRTRTLLVFVSESNLDKPIITLLEECAA